MDFIKDCLIKIGATVGITQALCWLFGVFDEATSLIKEHQTLVVLTLVVFVIINYISYDAPRALERIRYEKNRKKLPTRGRKRKERKPK